MFFFFLRYPKVFRIFPFVLYDTIRSSVILIHLRTHALECQVYIIYFLYWTSEKFYAFALNPWHNVRSRSQNTVTDLSFIPFIIFITFVISNLNFPLAGTIKWLWPGHAKLLNIVFRPAIHCTRIDHYKRKKKIMLPSTYIYILYLYLVSIYNSLIFVLIRQHTYNIWIVNKTI